MSTCAEIKQEITNTKAIITSLYAAIIANIGNSGTMEHNLDDGQVKMKTVYRSISAMYDDLNAFKKNLNILNQQLYGNKSYAKNFNSFNRAR